MVARVAIFEGINVEAAQASMDEAEAIIRPIVQALPGYQGMRELASQDGRFTIFAWSPCDDTVHAHRVETLLL